MTATASAPPGLPRISLAIPSGDMVHAAFAMAFAELSYASHPFALQFVSAKSSIVAIARNMAVEHAQAFAANYILFLDSDMTFPPTTLLRLLGHDKDVVGATYVKRTRPISVLGTAAATQPADAPDGLILMDRIPTGCLLIRMAVFAALSRPYFRFGHDIGTGAITGEDYVFCDDVRAAGFAIWCDTGLSAELGHIGQAIYRLADAEPGAVGAEGDATKTSSA